MLLLYHLYIYGSLNLFTIILAELFIDFFIDVLLINFPFLLLKFIIADESVRERELYFDRLDFVFFTAIENQALLNLIP